MSDGTSEPPLAAETGDGGLLRAERRRDGGVTLRAGAAGETVVSLDPAAARALAGWLAPVVEEGWIGTVRARAPEQLRLAADLFGDEPARARRLAAAILEEMPPALVRRALVLLANAIGPETRARLVARLNRTDDRSEEMRLRRRLGEEGDAFAYAVAAAALWDAADPDSPRFDNPTGG